MGDDAGDRATSVVDVGGPGSRLRSNRSRSTRGGGTRWNGTRQCPRIIIDSDLSRWWDDVTAIGMANVLQQRGQDRILAIMSDIRNPLAVPAIDAIDTSTAILISLRVPSPTLTPTPHLTAIPMF